MDAFVESDIFLFFDRVPKAFGVFDALNERMRILFPNAKIRVSKTLIKKVPTPSEE